MRIIYFLEGTFNSGGIERVVIGKANWLAEKGHDVTIITTDQNGRSDFFPLQGVKRIDLDLMYASHEKNLIKDYFRRRSLIKKETKMIKDLIKDLDPDIMISTFRYENHILPKLKDRSHKIAEIHFARTFRLTRNRKGLKRIIDKVLTAQDLRQAKKFEKFICLTDEDKHNWEGVKDVVVINNFIEPVTLTPASLENKKMIAVGRLSYQKGFDRLIDAWKIVNEIHPDWKLEIYGNGELKQKLEDQIKNLGIKDKVLINAPTKEIHQKYLESSALVMSSHYEGLPMVMLEAMEAGLPIVTFDYPCGPKDVVKNEVNGLIVKDGEISGLAEAICKLIENPQLRNEMGARSFELAKKYYKEEIMMQWEKLFYEILENRS